MYLAGLILIKFITACIYFKYICVIVDNDPHFIVRINGLATSVCFDVMGLPGDVLKLVEDNISGISDKTEIIMHLMWNVIFRVWLKLDVLTTSCKLAKTTKKHVPNEVILVRIASELL